MRTGVGRGHDERTVSALRGLFEKQRFDEEWRIRRLEGNEGLSLSETKWRASKRSLLRRRSLQRLRDIKKFKDAVASSFEREGYSTRILERSQREGIDLNIFDSQDKKWGVAKCKIPAEGRKILPHQIREFAGAFTLSHAEKGFFFTTGEFSRRAKDTALQFDWLTTFDGRQLHDRIGEPKG